MPTYKEKPKYIEAIQWFPGVQHDRVTEKDIKIGKNTYQGYMTRPWPYDIKPIGVKSGEWIIAGQEDPMSDVLFKRLYEPV